MTSTILAIDQGTTSSRAIMFDARRQISTKQGAFGVIRFIARFS